MQYKVDELLGKKVDDLPQFLVDAQGPYGEILRDHAKTEKSRMYWKVALSVVAGMGTSAGIGILDHNAALAADHAVASGAHAGGIEHAPTTPAAAEIQHVEVAQKGDSLWTLAKTDLMKEPGFNGLNDAQKTWMVSSLVNRTAEHHADFGFMDPIVSPSERK